MSEIKDINSFLPIIFLESRCVGGYSEFQDLVDNQVVEDILNEGRKQ